MGRAGAFVLPSHFEPWGVVLHEAAAAGRYIIATSACGAGDVLISPGVNGTVIPSAIATDLASALFDAAQIPPEAVDLARTESLRLARQASPSRLVRQLDLARPDE
jgi:glycosyltransferase involved in cell wall biosynthesis